MMDPLFLDSVVEENRFLFSSSLMHYSRCIRFDDSETGIRVDNNVYAVDVPVDVGTAPQTFDVGVIAAVSAIVSAAGYMFSKK